MDASIVTNGHSQLEAGALSHPYKRMERISGVVANLGRANPLQTMVNLRRARQQVQYYTGKYMQIGPYGTLLTVVEFAFSLPLMVKNLAVTGLVSTNLLEPIVDQLFDWGMEKLNVIVAVNVHQRYNQEDSLVMNRASMERGMFRFEHIISYKAEVDNKETPDKRRKADDLVNFGKIQSPTLGDKFSSMHGQKGVLGFLESQENFPFTIQGIVLDVVINPHAFPSRQTPAQLLEAALGKGIAFGGLKKYATPFSTPSFDAITEQLHRAGFSKSGMERVYNGRTVKFRNTGPVHPLTRQLVADRKRFGEMECDCLIAHGALANLHERLFMLSDSSQVHVCRKCKNVASVIQRSVGNGRKVRALEVPIAAFVRPKGTPEAQGIFLDMIEINNDIHLSPQAFKKMYNLRLLKFYDSTRSTHSKVIFSEGLSNLSKKLRSLIWYRYPLQALPSNYIPNNLVELDLRDSNLERLWEGRTEAPKLRLLNLSGCTRVTEIQGLSKSPLLESIDLEDCRSLLDFPQLAQHLKNLCYLHRRGCNSLRSFPSDIHFESLTSLDLSNCNNLTKFPQISGNNITSFDLSGTAITELHHSISHLNGLEKLFLGRCGNLETFPSGICNLTSLRHLDLSDCSRLEILPENLGNLKSLKYLSVKRTAIKELPHSISHLNGLEELFLGGCENLETLPSGICNLTSLRHLDLSDCSRLEILPENLGNLKSLEYLSAKRTAICQLPYSMKRLPENLSGRTRLRFTNSSGLGLPYYSCSLTRLFLSDCNLNYIPKDIGCLSSLVELDLSVNNFDGLPQSMMELRDLKFLHLDNCNMVVSLIDLPPYLTHLSACGCKQLQSIPNELDFARIFLTKPTEFIFTNCMNLGETAVGNMLARRMKQVHLGHIDFNFCYPGSEVPKWFRYTTEGSSIKFQKTFDHNLKGFAVCAVIAFEKYLFNGDTQHKLGVHFDCTCSDGDQSSPTNIMSATAYVVSRNKTLIDSDHVAFGYCHASFRWLLGGWLKNYSFEFRLSEESPNCRVKSCGVYPIYYNQLFVTDDSDGAGTSGSRFCEEEMEPAPKENENLQAVKYAEPIEHIGETSGIRRSRTSNDHLEEEVEIRRDEQEGEVRIFTDAGRILRPLLVVENLSRVKSFKAKSYSFQSLLDKGILELVGIEEEEDCWVAWGIKYLLKDTEGKKPVKYTHCELNKSILLGLSCGLIPFANHNHARRILYQAQKHSQQAIGFPTTNPNIRVDTLTHQFFYPQRPLFRTITADCLGKPDYHFGKNEILPRPEIFNGQNAIVAVNVHQGYNQEDSLVMNRASMERGMFRSEHIRSYKAEVDNKETQDKRRKADDLVKFGKVPSKIGRVDCLDDDGFPYVGANLQSGDIVIGKCTESADHSIKLKHTERGMVQKVVLSSNDDGKNFAVVSLRQIRSPTLGDKFPSMHGQMGVLGFLESQENFPFTIQGIVPDVVINPHAFPSRQTPAQLLEAALGKGIACGGLKNYATPFSTPSFDAITEQLHRAGFSKSGMERIYNGRTGEMVRSLIFMGLTFYQRLVHMAEDKAKFCNTGPVHPLTRQPVADRKRFGGIKFGEMERDCRIAHGASVNLHERLFTLSDPSQVHVCGERDPTFSG
ncbi:hypothetical protein EZV62_007253 [Acer yangbiense]|uniref:DNA-directed RNA polymerase subunit beta n=1 Tax=Acer yangbiense TaxID=1000413 RepID=A0A5C7IA21_9ROSI|nr:hypothetical protein EZV62_007253 [Acer yangbiense]